MDHFSPLVPAFVRALVLPVGNIERNQYTSLLDTLQRHCTVLSLDEIPSSESDEHVLSPARQPSGKLLYNYTGAAVPEQQRSLSPFEIWRDPLLVLGITQVTQEATEDVRGQLRQASDQLRERYGRVVHRHLLVLRPEDEPPIDSSNDNVTFLVYKTQDEDLPSRLVSTVLSISARFLIELSTYAQAMQASPNIQTPGQPAQGLLRALKQPDERPRSRQGTPLEPRSPSGDDPASRPTSKDFGSPPTSFDQINAASALDRSDSHSSRRSKSRSRKDSLDRVPVQSLSKEKLKDRGKARVGVVLGSIYLLAGQWSEALRILVDNTTRLRALSDHIWHAKGLEYTFVCLMLHVWAELDFQLPPICYQLSDKVRDRLSKAIVIELQQRVTAQQTPVEKLSASTPDLLRHVLLLYHATESSLELPYITVAEATVRFCHALATLLESVGTYRSDDVAEMVVPSLKENSSTSHTPGAAVAKLTKTSVVELLSHALPAQEENLAIFDYVSILTGVASVYAKLGMQRKRVATLRSIVHRLIVSMEQARKLGAAEMGIHPAASLSIENGSEALLNTMGGSKGLVLLAQTIVSVFGLQLASGSTSYTQTTDFGSDVLKAEILRDLLRLCEAAPDLAGISALVSAAMLTIVPIGPVDPSAIRDVVWTHPDEQARRLGMLNRSRWLAKQLGMQGIETNYWDVHLVRSIEFLPQNDHQPMIEVHTSRPNTATLKSRSNPLLYDPNAPKEDQAGQARVLVCGEPSICAVTMQNALDTSVDIEYIELITESGLLAGKASQIRLGPSGLQQVLITVVPDHVGKMTIIGCRVKVFSCTEQVYQISSSASRRATKSIKVIGQAVLGHDLEIPAKQSTEQVIVEVIEAQPSLRIVGTFPASTLMLLAGETTQVTVELRNESSVSAHLQAIECAKGMTCLDYDQGIMLEATTSRIFRFEVTAQRDLGPADIAFRYAASPDARYGRVAKTHLDITVHTGLQITWLTAKPSAPNGLSLSVDVLNTWHRPVQALCEHGDASEWSAAGTSQLVASGQIHRFHVDLNRWLTDVRACPDAEKCAAELSKRLRIAWTVDHRQGHLAVSAALCSPDVVRLIRGPSQLIILRLVSAGTTISQVAAGSFFVLETSIQNRSGLASEPLRLQLYCSTKGIVSNEQRHGIAVAGSTTQILPVISPGESIVRQFSLCALSGGILEIGASVSPILPSTKEIVEILAEHRLQVKIMG